jgi:hypothetical protein
VCETWYLKLGEEPSLRVFENRVLRRIFGPKSNEVTGEWRRLSYGELYALYFSPDVIGVIVSRMRWAGHVTCVGDSRDAYRWRDLSEGDYLEEPRVDRIILK